MSSKFLDKTGLDTLWAKIKSTFQTLGNLVTAWGSTPSDTKYPSEKLVKTSLDAKAPNAVTTEAAIATGDKLLFSDASDSSKTKRMSTGFDTGVTTTMLRRDGTFARVLYADEAWGGAFRTSLSPFDNYAFKNANCFFGAKASAIRVEYSTDGGTTWLDYGMTDAYKQHMLSQYGTGAAYCGKNTHIQPGYTGSIVGTKDLSDENIADQRLRITICECSLANEGTTASTDRWLYCNLRRIGIYMSTQSAGGGAHCLFEKRTRGNFKNGIDTWTTVGDYKIQGDSGWNSIPCGNATSESSIRFGANADSTYAEIRFTIWSDKLSATPAALQTGNLCIYKIVAYSELLWLSNSTNSNMGNYGVPYTVSQTSGSASFSKGITSGVAIPISSGGTGATTAIGAEYNILNQVADIDITINGDRKIALCNQTKSASNGVFRWLKLSNVWTWIKGLLSSESDVNISGNAATATTAAGYTSGGAIDTALKGKVDKKTGMGLSSNDFTTDEKDKLAGIAEGAEVNVQSDWNQTDSTADDYIKNKPQNLVQDASYVHTDNNYTTADKNKVDSAIQPGDSRLTRSVWSGGGTVVCGYKICTTYKIAGISGQASKIYAIVMGSMCLTNKYASQPQGSDSSGVDGALAMGSFMIWCEGNPDGTITARARLFSSDAAFNNDDIAICKKYVNGAVEWFVAFGPWDSSKAVTKSRSFGMSVCFDYVQNASIPDTLEAVPSGYGYEGYYSLWKHPYLKSMQQGAGSTTQPVYVTANGEVKTCKKLVQAVTSIDTSNMDPDVLYVM